MSGPQTKVPKLVQNPFNQNSNKYLKPKDTDTARPPDTPTLKPIYPAIDTSDLRICSPNNGSSQGQGITTKTVSKAEHVQVTKTKCKSNN